MGDCCNKDDLIRLGQRFDPKLRDPAAALQRGSEQFKVSFDNLRKAFTESSWARENISQKSSAGPQHSVSHERWCVEAEEPMMGSVE
jgi:hypothetical protein